MTSDSLDPNEQSNWQGFFELMRPPSGYCLGAAIGTTFGLSLDALTATLLSMSGCDGESNEDNAVASLIAITKLSKKVRILTHPGMIRWDEHTNSNKLVALFDRLILEMDPAKNGIGLFHPKVWVLRFEKVGKSRSGGPTQIGRVIVCSRNLNKSNSFEIASFFEGESTPSRKAKAKRHPFLIDVGKALTNWMGCAKGTPPQCCLDLPLFLSKIDIAPRDSTKDGLRLRWQGQSQKGLATHLPSNISRALVVSPFIRHEFISMLLSRLAPTGILEVVSTQRALSELNEDVKKKIQVQEKTQSRPVLYQVDELTDQEDEEGEPIKGIHAKMLLIEANQVTTTYVGSANATSSGWGLHPNANTEAMVEMSPGLKIKSFVKAFIRPNKESTHPWIHEFDVETHREPDDGEEAQRTLALSLRDVAKLDFTMHYDQRCERLSISANRNAVSVRVKALRKEGVRVHLVPLMLKPWIPLERLLDGRIHFENISLKDFSTFLRFRATFSKSSLNANGGVEMNRLLLARFEGAEKVLDERDEKVRESVLTDADPAAVMRAFLFGIVRLRPDSPQGKKSNPSRSDSIETWFDKNQFSIEQLLHAVAVEPARIIELKQLLVPIMKDKSPKFVGLCGDIETALNKVHPKGRS